MCHRFLLLPYKIRVLGKLNIKERTISTEGFLITFMNTLVQR